MQHKTFAILVFGNDSLKDGLKQVHVIQRIQEMLISVSKKNEITGIKLFSSFEKGMKSFRNFYNVEKLS